MDDERLIASLEADLTPVRPLPPPWRRLFSWLAIALPAVAFVSLAVGFRPDLADRLSDSSFVAQQIAMLVTVVVAGWAALSAVVPGTPRWASWVPAVPLLGWIATMGQQCWQDWVQWGIAGLSIGVDLKCIPGIAMAGAVPIIAMLVMLRKGAPYEAFKAIWWGTLASAALANAGLRLFHAEDAGMMVVVWQFGTVLAFSVAATLLRDRLLPLRTPVQVAV